MRWPTCKNNCKTFSDRYSFYCMLCKRAIKKEDSWSYPDFYKPIEDPENMIEKLTKENSELKLENEKLRLQLKEEHA